MILLVASTSFGLGRLSLADKNPDNALQQPVTRKSERVSTKTSQASTSTVFVGSKNSDKYHLPWCPGAKNIAETNKITWQSREEAEAAGYSPAANCEGL